MLLFLRYDDASAWVSCDFNRKTAGSLRTMSDFCFSFAVHTTSTPLSGTAFERFAVIMSVVLVWLYAFFLTVGGAYKNAAPKTQFHCRTDRSGLVAGAPW